MMRKLLLTLTLILAAYAVKAQQSKEELSQAAANPLANLMSFPFQNNLNMNYGEYNRNTNILNIQPVIPFAKGKLITRTISPSSIFQIMPMKAVNFLPDWLI
jgi:hypothetical protein